MRTLRWVAALASLAVAGSVAAASLLGGEATVWSATMLGRLLITCGLVILATLLAPPRQVPPPVPLPAGFEPIVPGGRSPGRCGVCLGPEPPDVRHAVRGCGQPLHRACLAGRARGRCPGPCGMRASYG